MKFTNISLDSVKVAAPASDKIPQIYEKADTLILLFQRYAVNTTKIIKNDMVKPELKPCITAKSIKINIDAKKTSKNDKSFLFILSIFLFLGACGGT
jgi:hypothetical protein